ncbi:ABC transporter ATP-binding protein [Ruegeria arenilitoris]|uniref:ABC transporter ATP-binding protein n=1 Tax=Ruegeria arenilitoris TaxID=1173585 RepID=UPI00148077DA|nr:ABC transporter ATP-binding protein [Ruegeria arenilitoris]
MTQVNTPLLVTKGLTKRFGGLVAIDDVNLTVSQGQLHCLIGPNGAGKSTFFKCLTGQFKPSSGTVTLEGQQAQGLQTQEIVRRGVGIKTQTPSLFDGLSVHENISLSALRSQSRAQAADTLEEMLSMFQITHLVRREVGQLAHGQRQLVELAIVLAAKPKLVLLDEPAAGMTGDDRVRLTQILRDLARRTTFIVVEHDMQFIGDIATNVTVFNRGRVFAEGSFAEIMARSDVQEIYLGKEVDVAA